MALKKEALDKLLEIEGKVRGIVFYTDGQYVLQKEGEEGLKKLESVVKNFGYEINYRFPDKVSWYPIGLRAISLLLIKDTFGWDDEEIKNMGYSAPNFSFLIKLYMKFFVSLKKIVDQAPKLWEEHYKVGKLSAPVFDEENKKLVLRLTDFKVHPILCTYLSGYFLKVASLGIKSKKHYSREIKCSFKGDPYDDIEITWE
jgi:hypothetical protein